MLLDQAEDLMIRLRALQPGESLVYHVGYLDSDRWSTDGTPTPVDRVAKLAAELWMDGAVELGQRRTGPPLVAGAIIDWSVGRATAGFAYIATGRRRQHPRRSPWQGLPATRK